MTAGTKDRKKVGADFQEPGAGRMLLYRMAALLLVPALFLGGLEVGLRLIGYGYPVKAMVEREIHGQKRLCLNTRFTWRYFPRNIAREFDSSLVFNKDKTPQTFRIFVLGGSAAMGFPEPVHNFGRLLETLLSEMYEGIDFEVHNAAIVAINSHVVRDIAADIAAYDPDLFIVYLGNNEVVGPFGPGTVLTSSLPSLPVIRANILLKGSRTGQLLDQLLSRGFSGKRAPLKWEGMAMFLDKQVRFDAPALDQVYHNYEQNLKAICETAGDAGIPVIFSSVSSNLKDCPPFASQHDLSLDTALQLQWEALYEQAVDHEENGRYAEAIAGYSTAAEIDATYADLQFRLAQCYWAQGEFEQARIHYQGALQYDTLRFRADERINRIIHDVAEEREDEEIYFVDSVEAFNNSSPHGIPGKDLFYEHVHMTFKGNYTLARALLPAVQNTLPAQTEMTGHAILSEEETAKRVAFTDYERWGYPDQVLRTVMSKPPFTNQLYHEEMLRDKTHRVERLKQDCDQDQCLKEYAAAIEASPEDWRLLRSEYQFMSAVGLAKNLQDEEALLRRVIALCPDHEALRGLAINLLQQDRADDAREVLEQLLVIRPNSSHAHVLLGKVARRNGQYSEAIRQYQKAIQWNPSDSIIPYGLLAQSYAEREDPRRSIKVLRDAIRNLPERETAWAHFQLGTLLSREGSREEALAHMETALRIQPEYAGQQVFQAEYAMIRNQ